MADIKRFRPLLLVLYGALLPFFAVWAVFYLFTHYARGSQRQPIAYNHKKHIALGLECSTCHTGIAEGRARAALPVLEICASCHGSADETPRAQAVRDYVSADKPIPWKKVYRAPNHVYFSHRRHVGLAKLDCALCHGDMSQVEAPVTRQSVKISMARCMDCHSRMKVTNDCMACHR